MVYMGSSCGMPVNTREIYRVAVSSGASSAIITHNHPGGTTEPSPEDMVLSKKLRRASVLLGIRFLDFIIFTLDGRYFSLMDQKIR
jgi:DNA repair protein RadC